MDKNNNNASDKFSLEDLAMATRVIMDGQKNKISETGLTLDVAEQIKLLNNRFNKYDAHIGDYMINVYTGMFFGHVDIHKIEAIHDRIVIPREQEYSRVDISSVDKIILWTDFSNMEPYDRQGAFYLGMRLRSMELTKSTNSYREYVFESSKISKQSLPVRGFYYNETRMDVQFAICIKPEQTNQYITELRKLLKK